ncbi:uncharacterized protein LOC129751503 [Uranotaenia lowii]|uniref:uncharacterized protein LOC129751503 n=1 Tax=Uranotaenia lowii TaxID=190385 RepID=UPI00247AA1AC|nr:uncharacterized protein LOC129751503 [Uranotaenia lowii]
MEASNSDLRNQNCRHCRINSATRWLKAQMYHAVLQLRPKSNVEKIPLCVKCTALILTFGKAIYTKHLDELLDDLPDVQDPAIFEGPTLPATQDAHGSSESASPEKGASSPQEQK